MDDLRRQIIEMMSFPRLKALDALNLETCPHGGVFHLHDKGCRTCQAMYECSWIKSNEPFVAMAQQSRQELVQSLRMAIDYVSTQNHRQNLKTSTCVCESCRWIAKANRLVRQAGGRSEVVKT